jgi:DNA repair protein RadC
MAERAAAPQRPRTAARTAGPARDSVGLLGCPFDAEPSVRAHPASPPTRLAPPETERCRALLDALLRHAWPDQAAAWSRGLIAEFGSLPAALAVGTSDRARRMAPEAARFLADIQSALLHCLRLPIAERPVISTRQQLLDYLRADMGNLRTERFRVLFLTAQNELMADDLVWEGTVHEAPVYPREVVKRALEIGATGLLLVHNHPSGNHEPSQGDIDATRRVAEAALLMGICVHDHIVISRAGWASFRSLGLLDVLPQAAE